MQEIKHRPHIRRTALRCAPRQMQRKLWCISVNECGRVGGMQSGTSCQRVRAAGRANIKLHSVDTRVPESRDSSRGKCWRKAARKNSKGAKEKGTSASRFRFAAVNNAASLAFSLYLPPCLSSRLPSATGRRAIYQKLFLAGAFHFWNGPRSRKLSPTQVVESY